MFGSTTRCLSAELRSDAKHLDNACQAHFGVTGTVFRAVKFLFYIATIVFTVYLIEFTPASWTVAVAVAVLFISGPEGLETYLMRQDTRRDDGDE